jgi:ABC-2 type transport system permease protein
MNSDNVAEFPAEPRAMPAPMAETRPLYWSVRRELWENRSIYLAPLIVAAVVLFASFVTIASIPTRGRNVDPAKQSRALVSPLKMAPAPIMLTTFLVAAFYCLDTLYSERRDRSILFWKSMPVSDATTLAAKASIPFVVLPVIALGLSVIVQTILRFLAMTVGVTNGISLSALREYGFFEATAVMVYGYYSHVLWFAPLFGWFVLVSAWARRMPVLWVVVPPMAIATLEGILFSSREFLRLVRYRLDGAMREAFAAHARDGNVNRYLDLDPVNFLTRPGLWLGLLFAAGCFAAAAHLRRRHEPI